MKSKENQSGFTLLEMLISTAVFAIVLITIYSMLMANHVTYSRGENKLELQQNTRVALTMMARDLRMAGYDPSDVITVLSTTPIQVANANDITFIGDVDGDGNTDQVRYSPNGIGQVMREVSSWNGAAFPAFTPSVLADDVSALTFTYYDGSDTVTTTLADIQRVTIGITTQATAAGLQQTYPLLTDARLRNSGEQ